jgi:HEAT repeat protein
MLKGQATNMSTIALTISLLLLGSHGCQQSKRPENYSLTLNSSPVRSDAASAEHSQKEGDVISNLEKSLWSKEPSVRTHGETELLSLAKSSAELRNRVIQELMKSVESQDELDGHHFVLINTFLFWRSATIIFADLQAIEAIDVMIRCIDSSNGLSGNMGEPPSAYALVRMGTIAIPKLSQALHNEPNSANRVRIVLCLSRIGGPQARAALRESLKTETNKGVRYYINRALS